MQTGFFFGITGFRRNIKNNKKRIVGPATNLDYKSLGQPSAQLSLWSGFHSACIIFFRSLEGTTLSFFLWWSIPHQPKIVFALLHPDITPAEALGPILKPLWAYQKGSVGTRAPLVQGLEPGAHGAKFAPWAASL